MNGNWFSKGIGRCYARCPKCFPILNEYLHSHMELECAEYICSLEGKENVMFGEDKRLSKIIPKYNIDIFVPSKNIAFEFNGLRWHNTTQLKLGYHLNKTVLSEEAGIKLFHIWEDEWVMDGENLKNTINDFLNGIYHIENLGDIIEVDRSKYNKCCVIDGYELKEETLPMIKSRMNSNNISYDIEDCGTLIYERIHSHLPSI